MDELSASPSEWKRRERWSVMRDSTLVADTDDPKPRAEGQHWGDPDVKMKVGVGGLYIHLSIPPL